MIKLFTPIILIAAAVGLFILYTSPTYKQVQALTVQNNSYSTALDKAQELRTVRDQLIAKRNSFSSDNIDKLQHILPDNVDNIRLIIDINNIAARHNLALTNVDLGDIGGTADANSGTQTAAVAGGVSPVGSVNVGFSVSTANYDDFLAFLQDLEHSLRIVDVTKLTFTAGASNVTTYALTVRTYWLH